MGAGARGRGIAHSGSLLRLAPNLLCLEEMNMNKEPKLGFPFDYGDENVWLFLCIVFLVSLVIFAVIFVILKWLAK